MIFDLTRSDDWTAHHIPAARAQVREAARFALYGHYDRALDFIRSAIRRHRAYLDGSREGDDWLRAAAAALRATMEAT